MINIRIKIGNKDVFNRTYAFYSWSNPEINDPSPDLMRRFSDISCQKCFAEFAR